jgi:hypothetical protein
MPIVINNPERNYKMVYKMPTTNAMQVSTSNQKTLLTIHPLSSSGSYSGLGNTFVHSFRGYLLAIRYRESGERFAKKYEFAIEPIMRIGKEQQELGYILVVEQSSEYDSIAMTLARQERVGEFAAGKPLISIDYSEPQCEPFDQLQEKPLQLLLKTIERLKTYCIESQVRYRCIDTPHTDPITISVLDTFASLITWEMIRDTKQDVREALRE